MFGPYLSISLPTWACIAAETVKVETITAIAKIKPMELTIARPFRLERFLDTSVKVFSAITHSWRYGYLTAVLLYMMYRTWIGLE
jgi:hypothetical protein